LPRSEATRPNQIMLLHHYIGAGYAWEFEVEIEPDVNSARGRPGWGRCDPGRTPQAGVVGPIGLPPSAARPIVGRAIRCAMHGQELSIAESGRGSFSRLPFSSNRIKRFGLPKQR